MKTKRLARELQELKSRRKLFAIDRLQAYKAATAPYLKVMPEPVDFCAFEPIKEILDQHADVDVDTNSFMHLMADIPDMVEQWREEITTKFAKRVKSCIRHLNPSIDDDAKESKHDDTSDESIRQQMTLAKTVYKCTECCNGSEFCFDFSFLTTSFANLFSELPLHSKSPQCKPLWYPRVLGHRCMTKPTGFRLSTDRSIDLDILPWRRRKWTCNLIDIDEDASEAAEGVIAACGLDPTVATADDMDELDARLECLQCSTDEDNPCHVVLGWRSAVSS